MLCCLPTGCTTDVLQVGRPFLPDDVNRADSKKLPGPHVLQVVSAADIAQPSKFADADRKGRWAGQGGGPGRSCCKSVKQWGEAVCRRAGQGEGVSWWAGPGRSCWLLSLFFFRATKKKHEYSSKKQRALCPHTNDNENDGAAAHYPHNKKASRPRPLNPTQPPTGSCG